MRTKQITLYQFDELSDKAKERAREWYREVSAGDNDFADFPTEDFAEIAAFCGWDIKQRPVKLMGGGTRHEPDVYWSVGYGGDTGASFAGGWSASRVNAAGLKAHAPVDKELHRLADRFDSLAATYPQAYANVTHSGRYFGMEFDCGDDAEDAPYGGEPAFCEAIAEDARDLAAWFHSALQAEYEYRQSDECVDENIRINEYEFNEDGTRARA